MARAHQRSEERVPAALKVHLDETVGITKDVSISGIYFESDADYLPGNAVRLMVELESPFGKMKLKCQGSIVRCDVRGGKKGVAVKLTESVLES